MDESKGFRPRRGPRAMHMILTIANPNESDEEQPGPQNNPSTQQSYGNGLLSPAGPSASSPRVHKPYPPLTLPADSGPGPSSRSNATLSSPSSTSSAAQESTPPPSTPGQPGVADFPPTGLIPKDHAGPWNEAQYRNGHVSEMRAPGRQASGSGMQPSSSPTVEYMSNITITNRTVRIAVTTDFEQFFIVDVTGAGNGLFILEKIFSKLQIPDEEQRHFSIWRTEIGQFALGAALAPEHLYSIICEQGDAKANLHFLVSHTSAAVHELPDAPPSIPRSIAHNITPPVLPYPDSYGPLKPRRDRSRSQHGGSVSSVSDNPAPEGSKGYEASVSDELEAPERDDNRPGKRGLPTRPFYPPPSPHPYSPSSVISPRSTPSEVAPLRIDKDRHRHNQQTHLTSSSSHSLISEEISTVMPGDFVSLPRTSSDSPNDKIQQAPPNGYAHEQPDSARPLPRAPAGRQFNRPRIDDDQTSRPQDPSSSRDSLNDLVTDGSSYGTSAPAPAAGRGPSRPNCNRVQGPLNIPKHPQKPPPAPPRWQRLMPKTARSMNDLRGAIRENLPSSLQAGRQRRHEANGTSQMTSPQSGYPGPDSRRAYGSVGQVVPNEPGRGPISPAGSGSRVRPLPSHASNGQYPPSFLPIGQEHRQGPRAVSPVVLRPQQPRMQSPGFGEGMSSQDPRQRVVQYPVPRSRPTTAEGALDNSSSLLSPHIDPSQPRSPRTPRSPRNSFGSQSEDDTGTFRPEEHQWLAGLLNGSHGEEETMIPPPKPRPELTKPLPPAPGTPAPARPDTAASVAIRTDAPRSDTLLPPSRSETTLVRTPSVSRPISSASHGWDGGETQIGTNMSGLWAEPFKPAAAKSPLPPLEIEQPSSHPYPSHPISSPRVPAPSSTSLSTRPSLDRPSTATKPAEPFRDAVDYPRPRAEDVYERLDTFFPEHNLDEPLIDAGSGGTSPIGQEAPPIPVTPSAGAKFKHKKSIRVVAQEHKRKIDRISRLPSTTADQNKLARRNTKLWGSKMEEVTVAPKAPLVPIVPPLPESPGSSAPKPIFKWVRGELIGKGSYGRVYLALNATTGEMIAVKQVEIPKTASDKEDSRQVTVVESLKSESETLKDLDHPHIVQYLGFEETSVFLSIFLEYVSGGSIGSLLRKHGKFAEDVTKSFTSQILSGLEYLHSKGILHRDLKADNILVEMSGACKISDFGISKRTDDLNAAAFTAMMGTVFWMAPEVVKTGKHGYNTKIDIWSVGCVVLEMWAGRRPWNEEEVVAVMFKLYGRNESPPVPADVTLSALADDFRCKCFAIDPEQRPSASELQRHPYLELPPEWSFPGFR